MRLPRHLCLLFKLNRCLAAFPGTIVHNAVNSLHLVDDSAGYLAQYLPRDFCCLCSHEIAGEYGAQSDGIVVCSSISHAADGSHICQCGKVLAKILGNACLVNLLAVDCICILYNLYLLRRDIADNSYAEAWPWERLAEYQMLPVMPSSSPAFLTSSLNSIRRGSIFSLKSTCSGSPPTL